MTTARYFSRGTVRGYAYPVDPVDASCGYKDLPTTSKFTDDVFVDKRPLLNATVGEE